MVFTWSFLLNIATGLRELSHYAIGLRKLYGFGLYSISRWCHSEFSLEHVIEVRDIIESRLVAYFLDGQN